MIYCIIGEQDMQDSVRALKAAPKLHKITIVHEIKTMIHKNTHT